ncbi:FMN-dependent NADH-azoreductase [Ureibacillus chungkukjangi]|uniref:FMN dependent NADH:quinone oxidoreductase n=1 Tax=Ureibacillus chungkukjangi TaxID=1202712 RepID=A0A318TNX0_9BACL|nr:FMN-dependent NADH-azoreductase [Ureibacillus chungkukjangi]MCM3389710.1 FMN-dependent NADH-azoreductase [Ureibacillus chungkukjangi]PYF06591.1 FMN-dependent NADH-azoreductase [Ureibacillus chungkukjangi]
MTNVLVIKANNRPDGVSTKMYEAYIEEAKKVEGVDLTIYDLFKEDTPYFGQELFDAFGKLQAGEALTEVESNLLAAKQKAMDAVTAADVVVLAFPLWNLTIPAKLQTFIDYVYSAGFMFKYSTDGQMIQLLTDKKFVVLNARGGFYSSPEAQPMEMSVNYIKNVFGGVAGMTLLDEVIIEGHNADPGNAQEIISEGIERVRASAQKLATVNV